MTLFIDSRKLGFMVDRTHRDLSNEEIACIARAYHAWRGEKDAGEYADVPGFCKSASTEEIANNGCILTPGRYVGAADVQDEHKSFEERFSALKSKLQEQVKRAQVLDADILRQLERLE